MCPIKNIFHIYCPGCGGSRALVALLTLHVRQSLYYNPSILVLFACIALAGASFLMEKKINRSAGRDDQVSFLGFNRGLTGKPGPFLVFRWGIIAVFLAFYIGYGIYRDWMLLARHVDLLGDFF